MTIVPESEVFKSYPLPQSGTGGFQPQLSSAELSGSIVNNNLPSLTNKVSEALPKFELFSSVNSINPGFSGLGGTGIVSKSFGALSNGSFNSSNILSGLGNSWQQGLSSLPSGFSGSQLQEFLNSDNSGGGGRS